MSESFKELKVFIEINGKEILAGRIKSEDGINAGFCRWEMQQAIIS